uniref:beta-fructofuranosidase n=1 Tax=Acrobeloides nanus TaxID=290746 RepID=A0A914D868_9BILA
MFRRSLILLIGFWIGSKFFSEAINVTNSRYRQNYHIIAPTGWLNDPNGLSYFNGNYHVFFQYDPTSSNGGGPKQWGHVTSTDLVNWKYTQPTIALAPDQSYDVGGVWTGSAVNNNGELTAIYTGLHNNTGEQLVNIATSTDGVTFTKYSGNPVVPTQPIDGTNQFRDPKVWKYNGVWYMVVGNQSKKNHGRTVLYQSDDLRQWTYLGPLADEPDNRVGSMWECPNFFYINGKHVLFMGTDVERDGDHFANQGLNVYFIGDFNYETKVFSHAVDFYELDNGHDFYAAQMFQDPKNRTILFAWMNSFGTNFEEMQDGWAHTLTVPRQLRLSSDGSRVQMIPVDELTLLRGTEYINSPIEIEGHDLRLYYDKQTGKLVLERTKDVRQVDMGSIMQLNLRIFLDQSSIEVFANDGNVTMSSRYYKDPIPTITLFAEYGVANVEFQAFRLNNIW